MNDLKKHIENINILLERIYKKPTLLSDILIRVDINENDIQVLKENYVREISYVIVDAIDTVFKSKKKYYRDFSVLSQRFGLQGEPKTLEQIGKEHSVTRERIRQIQNRALKKCTGRVKMQEEIEKAMKIKVKQLLFV